MAAPCFVKWRTYYGGNGKLKRKGRPVLDMREINTWIKKDCCPLITQDDIISLCRGGKYISVDDGTSYFYQLWVKASDRHKIATNTHRGQEFLNVAFMGFQNSVQYVQRMGNLILKDLPFARAYIDDCVIFSVTSEEHEQYLKAFFERIDSLDFSLAPERAYLGFSSLTLLGQQVDQYGYSATAEKPQALKDLEFPSTAVSLEKYIGLVNTMSRYAPYLP